MSAPNKQASTAIPFTAGRLLPDGSRVYRLVTPVVIWWSWVGLAVLSLGDLAIQGHNLLSLKFAFGVLTVTGLVFACTLWPKVITDDDGITVRNPFRSFDIPWGAVRGIFLADSLEVQCARGPQKKDKTVYSWALSSARRARARAKLHGWQWEQGRRNRPSSYGQLPGHAKELVKMTQTEVMAREMAQLSEQAKARLGLDGGDSAEADSAQAGAADFGATVSGAGVSLNGAGPAAADGQRASAAAASVVTSTWAWPVLAAVLLPGIAFAIAMLAG